MIKKHIPSLILISIACIVVYFNSINGGFIVDDIPAFKDNPNVKDLGYAFINYNPQTVLYALTYYLFGLSTAPQHTASIIIHIVNSILAYFLILKLGNKKTALVAAMLFALHPVNVESVAWMSGRSYLFNGLIFFITSNIYFKHLVEKKYNFNKIYVIFGLLVILFGNAWTVLIPFQLLILQIAFFPKEKTKLKLLAPIFLIVGIYIGLILVGGTISSRQSSIGEIANGKNNSLINIDSLIFSLTSSTELLFFPKNLTLYHLPTTPIQIILLILIGIVIAFIVSFKVNRRIFYHLLLIYMSFSICLVPFLMTNQVAERYLYLSSFFTAFLVAQLLTNKKLKIFGYITVFVICILFSLKIISRNQDWKDSITFWNAEIRTNPNNARLYAELGYTYITEVVNYKLAVTYIAKSLEIDPNQFFAYHNLGKIYGDIKDYQKASLFFNKALKLNPNYYVSWYGLAYTEFQQNNKAQALLYINKTIEIKPNYTKAWELKERIEQMKTN